ncbi:RNA polymerase factor sigma-54 [Prevotella sp. E9-3]|uniref:RNA polymerase factor sigma-54 n=1 Tax=Prevotella sp. E9-3 TaxID=2913621 RepID=UPI001EDBE076|nr:RNA polymerase factor sigma-54 [Prevotella sp. E9-3]UKK48183.1 RNA polymerase factor sigma-54 [Prevotella sp. E9-3]
MAQSQIQEQKLEQKLQQSISAQQLLQAQLVELPITQLMERIETEMHDNPALETSADEDMPLDDHFSTDGSIDSDDSSDDDFDLQREREERSDALDAALENIGRDDEELPVYHGGYSSAEEREDMVYGDTLSFYDQILQQVNELQITERERYIMEYLIGSLDDDGLLRKELESISDELAIYHNVDATTDEIEQVLHKLQQLDPPGIGARSLQECLLLQIDRKGEEDNYSPTLIAQMREVISNHFEEFTKKHWDRIRSALGIKDNQVELLQRELRRLNPKPGASMGESVGRSMQQITPDFIVDTQDDGTLTFSLNNGELPQLQVSQSFADLLKDYQQNKEGLSRQMKEALLYTKQKVDAAQSFIEAVRTRRHTLTVTMKAIIQIQHRFFEDGDEASLRPMILKDVAAKTGLDLSTISRVSNSKYVLTRWGMFPLKFFFSDGFTTESGEELSTREIKAALREIIEGEDKKHPFSDDALSDLLKQKGYPVARRTVAKYRDQMGFPVARLRK